MYAGMGGGFCEFDAVFDRTFFSCERKNAFNGEWRVVRSEENTLASL
jgi:hypothetical protein